MAYVMKVSQTGGPEVIRGESASVAVPGSGEIRIKQTAVGLNYIDTYHRSGLYPVNLPAVLGVEAAGVVDAVGEGVSELKPGDKVAYAQGPLGAYADERVLPADKVVKLPPGISGEVAAASLLKGMTVEYLFYRTFPLQKGQTLLFHAAAGGVGLLACQWARALGCTVIGTAGSPEKAQAAKQAGCDHVILYRRENVAERVMEITRGQGVPVVYDGVGKDTFEASIACLAPRGMLVSFGQASGAIPEVNLKVFAAKSLFFTRPSLFVYNATHEEMTLSAQRFFDVLSSGQVKVQIHKKYSLREAAQAHCDLEARKLTGSTILIP